MADAAEPSTSSPPKHRSHRSRSRDRSRRHSRRSHRKGSDHEDEAYRKRRPRSSPRHRSKERSPADSTQRRRNGSEIPDQTIMIRGLAPEATEEDIRMVVQASSLEPKDIRLMRHKDGVSRGFAFVEFHVLADAVRWKELTQGEVVVRGAKASLYYSIRENVYSDKSTRTPFLDWNCYNCGLTNFRRRMQCFKCSAPRELSEGESTGDSSLESICSVYTDRSTLELSHLSPLTSEGTVLSALGQLTQLPIKALHLLRQISNIRCLVEMNSAAEAAQLYNLLQAAAPFTIDSTNVIVNYARKSISHQKSVATANVASAALAAAQWTNHIGAVPRPDHLAPSSQGIAPNNLGTVMVNGVSYPRYPVPDVSTFQYDSTSGFYYDGQTGLYYDGNSQYFYQPESQKYMYWDGEHSTYLPATSTEPPPPTCAVGAVVSAGPVLNNPPAKPRPDKNKVAKKIAKDMEKWAKAVNNHHHHHHKKPLAVEEVRPSEAAAVEQPDSLAGIVAAYGGDSEDSEDDPLDAWTQEVASLLDWKKLVCRLCKRQFHSKELLTKHQQLSALHLQNLSALKISRLTSSQIEELDKREAGYRDRAKERREKFGPRLEQPQDNCLKEHYLKQLQVISTEDNKQKVGGIGSQMLKAMGWSEGQGLGKDNQGMAGIIEVTPRVGAAGLGTKPHTVVTPFDYRENGKKIMQARYREMTANETPHQSQ